MCGETGGAYRLRGEEESGIARAVCAPSRKSTTSRAALFSLAADRRGHGNSRVDGSAHWGRRGSRRRSSSPRARADAVAACIRGRPCDLPSTSVPPIKRLATTHAPCAPRRPNGRGGPADETIVWRRPMTCGRAAPRILARAGAPCRARAVQIDAQGYLRRAPRQRSKFRAERRAWVSLGRRVFGELLFVC